MNLYKIIRNPGRGTLTISKIVKGVGKWGWCNLSIPEGACVNLSRLYPRPLTSRSAALEAAVRSGVVEVVELYRNAPPPFKGKLKIEEGVEVVEESDPNKVVLTELTTAPAVVPAPVVVPAPEAAIPVPPLVAPLEDKRLVSMQHARAVRLANLKVKKS